MTLPVFGPSSDATSPTETVRQLIARTHELGVLYACEWSPLSDITLALLLTRAGIRWRYVPLRGLAEIVWPPICGIYVMHIEPEQTPGERRFAIRHGLGHVLAGHVADLSYAHDGHDWRGHEETVADLFAIADLIPDYRLEELREAGYLPEELECWTRCEVRRYVPDWPDDRLGNRVRHRLAM